MPTKTKGFDWDAGNIEKCCKHGVTLEEIESLFHGVMDVFPDVAHSGKEPVSWHWSNFGGEVSVYRLYAAGQSW